MLLNKPARYGLKVFILYEAKTFYVFNLEVYCVKHADGQYNQANTLNAIIHLLLEEVKGSNINLTCDNWYSNYPSSRKKLLLDKITMIGTLKEKRGATSNVCQRSRVD